MSKDVPQHQSDKLHFKLSNKYVPSDSCPFLLAGQG